MVIFFENFTKHILGIFDQKMWWKFAENLCTFYKKNEVKFDKKKVGIILLKKFFTKKGEFQKKNFDGIRQKIVKLCQKNGKIIDEILKKKFGKILPKKIVKLNKKNWRNFTNNILGKFYKKLGKFYKKLGKFYNKLGKFYKRKLRVKYYIFFWKF